MKMTKVLIKNASDPKAKEKYVQEYAQMVKQFEAEFGKDWEDTMLEYDSDFVSFPLYVYNAARSENIRTVLQWLGKGNIKARVNAKCEDAANAGLLYAASAMQQYDLMSYLLLNGADVNILNSPGISVLSMLCSMTTADNPKTFRLLLSWGAELFFDGKLVTSQEKKLTWCRRISERGYAEIAQLISPGLAGRRCEIISAPSTRVDLIGKTCVVEGYLEQSDQCKVTMEFTNEVLLLSTTNLERRDRTPKDPGYYVECNNNRLIRRDFKSNEECQTFVANLSADEDELAVADPDAEAKAERAAAELLAELGLGDLDDPSSNATKKEKKAVSAGKKKKRGDKRKGRK